MHSPNTLRKVTAQPYFRTKALPSSTVLYPGEGIDLMKGELWCTLRRVFVQTTLRVRHSSPIQIL